MLHVLSHSAYVKVLLLIVEHVRLMERILQELALHLLVEHFRLDKRGYLIGYHIFIVHLTAIDRVAQIVESCLRYSARETTTAHLLHV